jgi:hypothetical protein
MASLAWPCRRGRINRVKAACSRAPRRPRRSHRLRGLLLFPSPFGLPKWGVACMSQPPASVSESRVDDDDLN